VVYDPAAIENAKRQLGSAVAYATSAAECARQADVLVITTAWAEFKKLTPADLKSGQRRPAIIDCWRILPANLFADLTDYLRLGYGGLASGSEDQTKDAGIGIDEPDLSRAARIFSVGTD